jgi:16S rRNA (adenine1518-N6/adenine1519-N6)-dimethyltransferase
VPDTPTFFRVVRAGFGQKRKQLRNSISSGLGLDSESANALFDAAAIDPRRRAETLSLEEWAALTRAFSGQLSS